MKASFQCGYCFTQIPDHKPMPMVCPNCKQPIVKIEVHDPRSSRHRHPDQRQSKPR